MEQNDLSTAPTIAYREPKPGIETEQTLMSTSSGKAACIPQLIPGYEMMKELGRGGMGVVYLARQQSLNRLVALKMILSGQHASAIDLARFKTEAEAVAQLQHPHIVQVIETGDHQGTPWFSMEYVAGGSLERRLQGRPLPPREAARITSMLAEAVAHAHSRGVLHRDLKPGNILVHEVDTQSTSLDSTQKPGRIQTRSNTVELDSIHESPDGTTQQIPVTLKITDFGLAKQVEEGKTLIGSKTQAGTVMGSPSYMAPEQAAGDSTHVGPAVDIYALGAMLYEMLTGRPPFRASSALDTLIQVMNDEPVPPTRLMPRLPKDIETICLKCLAKDPKKRYQHVTELDDDIQRFLNDEPIQARPIAWWERTWKAAKRRPTLTGLIFTALAAIAAILAIVLIDHNTLQQERNIAKDERDKALVAMNKAENEQKKAQKRLEKAVEAVEKLLTRTASENWARRPELQEERKKLLEEAVTFYQSFLEQESDDPMLRHEAGRVYFRMAALYLLLGDSRNAQEVLHKTRELQESLCKEFPDTVEYQHELVKTVNLLGNAEVMQGQFKSSLNTFEKAAKKADALAQAFPENVEFQLTQVRTYLSLYHFFLNNNAKQATEYLHKALTLGLAIYEKDSKPYLNQLIYLSTLIETAQLKLNQNQPAEVKVLLEKIKPLLTTLEGQAAPSVQDRDQFETMNAKYAIIHGYSMVRGGETTAGEAELQRGVSMLDNMLVQRPKMFPVRMLQMNALQTLGEVQDRQQKVNEAKVTIDRSFKIQDQMLKEMPQMSFLKGYGSQQRSQMLIMRAREGAVTGFERSAEDFLHSRQVPQNMDLIYNVACGYAQASQYGSAESKEQYAKRAIGLLNELYQKKYFTIPRIEHLLIDPDLAPLREREDFKVFMKQFSTRKKVEVRN